MNLGESEYKLLRELQLNEKQKRNYIKITVLLMLHLGDSAEKIALSLGISIKTIQNYQRIYTEQGLDFYLSEHFVPYRGKLKEEDLKILSAELRENFYSKSAEICIFIQNKFGLAYTSQGLVPLLHRLGFSYKKTKLVPCEADIEQQEAFVQDFESLMSALGEQEVVYFADAVHPQHNTRASYGWIAKGEEKEVLSLSGRQRINLNGVVNAQVPSEILVVEANSINAQNTWALYQKIEAQNLDKEVIYVICDNARYYKNKELQEKLKNSKIKQIFLPPYSPNLNLIERVWKFMRKKVIDNNFCRSFQEFRTKLLEFFQNIAQFKDELESLLAWNFHIPKSQNNLI